MAKSPASPKKPAARSGAAKVGAGPGSGSDYRKLIIAKAVVDPAFRSKLLKTPEKVFMDDDFKDIDRAAVDRIAKMLPALNDIIKSLAGEVLCGGGGGCGGLA